jgi:hypothetical protein
MTLLQHHSDQLDQSAIPADIRRDRGYWSATSLDDWARRDGDMADYQRRLPGLGIPVYRLGRTKPYTMLLRPDEPRVEQRDNGKVRTVKYEWPAGLPLCIDILPRYRDSLRDSSIPIWFTEGAKKADSLAGLGQSIIPASLNGVWCWKHKTADGQSVPLSDFDELTLKGRQVVLAFDSDQAINKHVQQALHEFATFLASRGATVGLLKMPHGESKLGVDDAIAAGWTFEQLSEAIEWRRPAEPFRIYRGDAIDQISAPRQLIKGYLSIGTVALLIGPSEAGKSTIAVDIANKVAQHYGVLYVAGEDGANVRAQVRAWEMLHNKPRSSNLAIVDGAVLLNDDAQVSTFISAARTMAPRLIVIDTLSSCIPGVDENSSEIGRVTFNLNRISDELQAVVLVLHHPLKYDGETFRGHSSLLNNTHTMLVAHRDEGDETISLKVTRHKGTRAAPTTLRLIIRATDIVDPDDGPLSAPVVMPANRILLDDNHLSVRQQAILQYLADLDADGGATSAEIAREMAGKFKTTEGVIRKDIASLVKRQFMSRGEKQRDPRKILPEGRRRIESDRVDQADQVLPADPFVINARLDQLATADPALISGADGGTGPQDRESDLPDPTRSTPDPALLDQVPRRAGSNQSSNWEDGLRIGLIAI